MAKVAAEKKAEKKREENAIVRYFRETWFEIKRVSWPTRSEAVNLTIIVVLVTTFLALVLGFLDWAYSQIFSLLL